MQGFFNEVALDLVRADGTKLSVLANARERRDPDGNLLFTRLTILEATERRRYERDLVEARAAAERGLAAERATSELREHFVAVLGHDLRNPLAGLDAGLRRLERDGLNAKTAELLPLMHRSISRMHELIDNVLDLARSRLGGGLQLHVQLEHQLAPTLLQIVEELRAAYPDREIDVRLDVGEGVDCDPARIGQLFSNLLANALTHGAKSVPIRVGGLTANGEFTLSVANGGDPIPPATMERLFVPFYRGEGPSSSQGLGLGLYIASQIAEAHEGRIDVASDVTETRFTFRMPLTLTVV